MFIKKMTRYLEDLKSYIDSLLNSLRSLDDLLSREADAVALSDLQKIEELTSEKIILGEHMEVLVQNIKSLENRLRVELFESLKVTLPASPLNLDDFVDSLNSVIKDLNSQELIAIYNLIKEATERVIKDRKSIFPKVESNAYMIKKLLHYHRETYSFWQSVAGESESTYGQTGKSKAVPQRSILSVRT